MSGSKKKRRQATFAEVVEAVASVPSDEQTLWHRVDELVEPDRVQTLVAAGVPWQVEWCWGGSPSDEDTPTFNEILAETVGEREVKRYRKKRSVPTVFVAEEWQNDEGGTLVLFVEQGPETREDPGPLPLTAGPGER